MKWSQDTSILKHEKKYLVCTSTMFDEYAVMTYYNKEDIMIEFNGSGFYILDWDEDKVVKVSWNDIEYWMEVENPEYYFN